MLVLWHVGGTYALRATYRTTHSPCPIKGGCTKTYTLDCHTETRTVAQRRLALPLPEVWMAVSRSDGKTTV